VRAGRRRRPARTFLLSQSTAAGGRLLLEELHYRNFLRAQPVECCEYCLFIILLERREQLAVEIGVDDFWMDITFAANRGCVAQLFSGSFYSLSQMLFCLRLCFRVPQFCELANRNDCP
jgi:hypothetical protein